MIFFDLESRPDIIEFHFKGIRDDWVKSKLLQTSLNRELKNFIDNNLKKITTGKPDEIYNLNQEFINLKSYKNSDIIIKKIRKVIDYKGFTNKSQKKYDAYDLANKLDIRTCLYCNRMYTLTIKKGIKKEEKLTRPQFDHFFDKGKNPLLALSIYNLIPSCNICNSTLKHSKKFTLNNNIHPYIDNINENYKYYFETENVESLLGTSNEIKVLIKINGLSSNKEKAAIKNKDIFRLEDIMTAHNAELKDLLDLRHHYSKRYFEELIKTFNSNKLKLNPQDLYRQIFGTEYESKDFVKRPFSKLKRDLLKELEIISPKILKK